MGGYSRLSDRDRTDTDTGVAIPLEFVMGLTNAATLDDAYREMSAWLPRMFPCDRISIALHEDPDRLTVVAFAGGELMREYPSWQIDESKMGQCFKTREPVIVNDTGAPGDAGHHNYDIRRMFASVAMLPLIVGGECLGTLNLGAGTKDWFSADTVRRLQQVAAWIALQIGHHRTADHLKASESRFNALIENAHSLIFAKNAGGRVLIANNRYCELLGRDQDAVIGALETDLFDPAQAAQWAEEDRAIIASGQSRTSETTATGSDGVERTYIAQKFPIFDPVQNEYIVCGIATDITDQKRAERALAESEGRMRAFFGHSPTMMYIKDTALKLTYVNSRFQEFNGLTEDEILGQRSVGGFDPDARAAVEKIDGDVLRTGKVQWLETRIDDADGNPHEMYITKFPIHGPDGEVAGIGGINTDVTELRLREKELLTARDEAEKAAELFKDAAEKAQIADRAKSEFLATMSHELRTPLNGVLGMANLLRDSGLDSDQANKLETIRASGQSLLAILNDILDLSKIDSGEFQLENQDFSLESLMAGVEDMWQPQVTAKGLDWTCHANAPLAPVLYADSARVRQVIYNLVSNALKFTATGSIGVSVTQSARPDGTIQNTFEIADTGAGIPPGMEAKLFEKFTQADSTISRRYGGTGLGLAICKSLVGQMGGSISYDSTPGQGATFRFTTVCIPGNPDNIAAPDLRTAETQSTEPLRILVAEDNAVNQKVIELMLIRAGHRCDIVGNGLEALTAIRKFPYDVVMMDIQMPEMDGLAATTRIREFGGRFATIPIIALTANAMKGDREIYLEAGMNDYVSKPIDPAALDAALVRQAGSRTAEGAMAGVPAATTEIRETENPVSEIPASEIPVSEMPVSGQGAGMTAELDAMFDALELPSSG